MGGRLKEVPKAIIKLGYKCNNNCLFCHAREKKQYGNLSLADVKNKLSKLKALGIEMVLFSGGEPTIRKDILEIAGLANQAGFPIGLVTNGRLLSNEGFLKKMVSLGLKYCYISLHGPDADTHNSISMDKSFEQTIKGTENIVKHKIYCIVNVVVIKDNIDKLKEIIDLARKINIKNLKFSCVEPIKSGGFGIVPKIAHAAGKVKEAILYGLKLGLNMGWDGYPLCLMGRFSGHLNNLKINNIKFISEVYEDEFFPADEGNRKKTEKCGSCSKKGECGGVYDLYLMKEGDDEINPL